jgi:glycosyltransferase involved in cell wall biosynthesis
LAWCMGGSLLSHHLGGGTDSDVDGRLRVHPTGGSRLAAAPRARRIQGHRGSAMRVLLVANNVPWPPRGGGLIRLAQVVGAMVKVADVDLFIIHDPTQGRIEVPAAVTVHRWTGAPYPRTSGQLRWRLDWAVRRGIPLEVVKARADDSMRLALQNWARPPYDAVWFSTAPTFEWAGRPDFGPTIVDLMDLEDVKATLRARLLADQLRRAGVVGSLRNRLAWGQARLNGSDWRRFQRQLAADVKRLVVPSDLDAARLGLSNVAVIPNTYPRPERPVGDPSAGGPPIVLFQGSLDYPPNIDGAEWLADAIAPRIREVVPATEVRLVGRPATSLAGLHRPGVVTVAGQVASMEDELARATVAVVPVRFGSGTRVKILESFAHRVPVVSTTLGAEGLDVEDGVHLLLADEAGAFAEATIRLLGDARLRVRLTEAAREHYLGRYDGRAADEGVRRLLEEVAGVNTRS